MEASRTRFRVGAHALRDGEAGEAAPHHGAGAGPSSIEPGRAGGPPREAPRRLPLCRSGPRRRAGSPARDSSPDSGSARMPLSVRHRTRELGERVAGGARNVVPREGYFLQSQRPPVRPCPLDRSQASRRYATCSAPGLFGTLLCASC